MERKGKEQKRNEKMERRGEERKGKIKREI